MLMQSSNIEWIDSAYTADKWVFEKKENDLDPTIYIIELPMPDNEDLEILFLGGS
jgi:hypothetical protein